ncbi:MAG: molybdopterin-dependent oxidoreductase [Clostridiales bacterium]|nr:molybdopterin-dependent oxidoreductase [Clostridiales bacterium]
MQAFYIHGSATLLYLGWILYHGIQRLFRIPRPRPLSPSLSSRRAFLASFLAGIGVSALWTLGGRPLWNAWVRWTSPSPEDQGPPSRAYTGFQPYTVTGGYPRIDPGTFRLTVEGEVENPLSLSLEDLLNLPQTYLTRDFHCVTGWSVAGARWGGVKLTEILRLARPTPQARYLHFFSLDGIYTESLTLSQAEEDVLLTHSLYGRPLPIPQGYPLRLLVPRMYGYKSIKWLGAIHLSREPLLGYWEQRGYPVDAYFTRQEDTAP